MGKSDASLRTRFPRAVAAMIELEKSPFAPLATVVQNTL